MMKPREFWLAAAEWGSAVRTGDPGACMYGFDERGLVQDEMHRADCIEWLETEGRKAADANVAAGEDPAEQHPRIDALLEYLRSAPSEAVAAQIADLDGFTSSYVMAALWSTNDESNDAGGDPLDQNYSSAHITPDSLALMRADCERFKELYGHLISGETYVGRSGAEVEENAGHDFWLTRCGHGAGFWDGDWRDPEADILTKAAKSFGEVYLYVGDDGFIHADGGQLHPEPVSDDPAAPEASIR